MRQEKREVRTPDGRCVEFQVAGPEGGDLVFFHTGTPGGPYLYGGWIRQCAERGLRVACVARPGYSGSDRLPGRSYADNPGDTALVADELGAETFFVIGHSGGGGPALADAALLPDRVRAAAVCSTLAPPLAMGPGWREGLELNEGEIKAMEAGKSKLREHLEDLAVDLRQSKTPEEMLADPDFMKIYSPPDRACFKGEFLDFVVELRPRLVTSGVDGWLDDDLVFFGDWGFDPSQIAVPVAHWQGAMDNLIPVAHGQWFKESVPGVRFHLEPKEGHISLLVKRFDEILDELVMLGS